MIDQTTVNKLLWIASIVSIFAYSFWRYLWEFAFYPIQATFIFLLSIVIFIQNKNLFISFFLLCASFGNLCDELFFDNTTTTKNEIIFALTILIIWYIKFYRMPERLIQSELYIFITKIIFPAFIAVGVKMAIEMKRTNTKVSMFNVFLSLFTGVGSAYLSSGIVQKQCSTEFVPVAIAIIAILSEKIGEFLIYKLNVDVFLTAATDSFFNFILNLKNKK